jgi:RecA-family ATPase
MNLLNEWCEQDNKTIILIHHHSKGEGGTARGAGAFIDACRIHYTLDYKYTDKEKKEIDDRMRVLRIEKTNHFSGKKEYDLKLFDGKESIRNQNQPKKTVFVNKIEFPDF